MLEYYTNILTVSLFIFAFRLLFFCTRFIIAIIRFE